MISNRRVLPRLFDEVSWFLIVYFVLVFLYSTSTPLFEAPDAYFHYAVIDYIAHEGQLPPKSNSDSYPWRQMTYHAPLYHMISAALIAPLATDDFLIRYPLNPHARIGVPDAESNRNFVAHTGDPWQNTGLAVRIVRLFSMVCGAVTLLSVYWLAANLLPRSKRPYALVAMALVLFNPQFLYLSGVINNDNLVIALTTVSLAFMIHIVKSDLNYPKLVALAVLLAMNTLAKASALAVYPVAMILMTYVCIRDRLPLKRVLAYGIIGVLAFAVLAGWWYLANWLDFGDPTATYQVAEYTQLRSGPIDVLSEMRGLYYSFWGLFGWFNIRVFQGFYDYVTILIGFAFVGLFIRLPRLRRMSRDMLVATTALMTYVVVFVAFWWRFNTLVQAAQGRLWFPMLGVFAVAGALGLSTWRLPGKLLLIPLAFFSLFLPVKSLYGVYSPSLQLDSAQLEMAHNATVITFREPWLLQACAELFVFGPAQIDEGFVTIDHAWGAQCQVTGYWSVFAHLSDTALESCEIGDTRHILSQFDSMPDGGRTPLPALKPGYLVRDEIKVPIPEDMVWSDSIMLQMGLYDAGGTFIRAFTEEVSPSDGRGEVSIGRCSPEMVNIAIAVEN